MLGVNNSGGDYSEQQVPLNIAQQAEANGQKKTKRTNNGQPPAISNTRETKQSEVEKQLLA